MAWRIPGFQVVRAKTRGARRRLRFAWEMLRRGPMPRASYSAEGEDVLVRSLFDKIGIELPSYLDIGANHPFCGNNTALFYWMGSRGINVDANPDLLPAFLKFRPGDVNLNLGIGPEAGRFTFYKMTDNSNVSTFDRDRAYGLARSNHAPPPVEISVAVLTLHELLLRHPMMPDFLSLDLEGLEYSVLKSCNFRSVRPKVVCAETCSRNESGDWVGSAEIVELMQAHRYRVAATTHLNTIFVDREVLPSG